MIVGLVDCNNFYASCERVFRPDLRGRPVVVLSNNDGCVIARSSEAKKVGIPMGAPYFKHRQQMLDSGVTVCSSNYALYGDMSNRVMTALSTFAPEIEIYSIDECFLDFSGMDHINLTEYCRHIREQVTRWTGIPVSIGIGPTKTLSKIANRLAKKSPRLDGVLVLSEHEQWLERALKKTEIVDVWGIGRRWAKMLQGRGIMTARDFRDAPEGWVRQKMGVVGARTQLELRGTPCSDLEPVEPDKQTVCVSRSFGKAITEIDTLQNALKTFCSGGAAKIRRLGLVTCSINIFIRTNPHKGDQEQYSNGCTIAFPAPTDDTREIISTVLAGLRRIYRPRLKYKKAGILLLGLTKKTHAPATLFSVPDPKSETLMAAFDDINDRLGNGLLTFGQTRKSKTWYMTQNHASPRFTTRWDELALVK